MACRSLRTDWRNVPSLLEKSISHCETDFISLSGISVSRLVLSVSRPENPVSRPVRARRRLVESNSLIVMYMKRKLFSTCLGAGVMATLSLFPQCAVAAGEPVGADTLTLMTYNVRNANGLDGVRSVERVAAVIRQSAPDVVAVQELDSATARAKGAYILGKLAAATGMTATYGPAISFDGGKYGLGLLSRQRPLSVRQVALPGREERRTMLIVEFPNYAVACIHFSLTEADRMASLPLVREAVAGMKNKTVFIAGDWNATPERKSSNKSIIPWEHFTHTTSEACSGSISTGIPHTGWDISCRNSCLPTGYWWAGTAGSRRMRSTAG